jgi:hypothetical protein
MVTIFIAFMERECSLQLSQKPVTSPYREPLVSRQTAGKLFFQNPFLSHEASKQTTNNFLSTATEYRKEH